MIAGVPLAGILPFALLLACPLMMVFMMKNMRGRPHGGSEDHTGHGVDIAAVVSRGGRLDLAGTRLAAVRAPTLLIVGGEDDQVLNLSRMAPVRHKVA